MDLCFNDNLVSYVNICLGDSVKHKVFKIIRRRENYFGVNVVFAKFCAELILWYRFNLIFIHFRSEIGKKSFCVDHDIIIYKQIYSQCCTSAATSHSFCQSEKLRGFREVGSRLKSSCFFPLPRNGFRDKEGCADRQPSGRTGHVKKKKKKC